MGSPKGRPHSNQLEMPTEAEAAAVRALMVREGRTRSAALLGVSDSTQEILSGRGVVRAATLARVRGALAGLAATNDEPQGAA